MFVVVPAPAMADHRSNPILNRHHRFYLIQWRLLPSFGITAKVSHYLLTVFIFQRPAYCGSIITLVQCRISSTSTYSGIGIVPVC